MEYKAWNRTSMSAGPECVKLLEIKQERTCVRPIFFDLKSIVCKRSPKGPSCCVAARSVQTRVSVSDTAPLLRIMTHCTDWRFGVRTL
jgi:hypothetical protein